MSDTTETSDFEDGVALIGALMTRNATDLAWTRDRIEEGLRDEVKWLRTLVADMSDVFERATVVDRATENHWRHLEPRIWTVMDAIEREGSSI